MLNKYLLLLIFFTLFSCKKNKLLIKSEKSHYTKNVLVIMEANNNLTDEALNSINALEQGAVDLDGILLVYIKTNSTKSYLLRIKHDEDSFRIVSDTVKVFDSATPTSAASIGELISYVQKEYASDHYGLVLWSHATSWAPPATIKTEAFGNDRGTEIDVIALREVMPNNFDFIIFDACNMASVEVLYEFKEKAKFIIASPTETIADSFPYKEITPLLFRDNEALKAIAKIYVDYYNLNIGLRQSATVSVVKTSELSGLAKSMKLLVLADKKVGESFVRTGVQRLDFTLNFPVPCYDFGDFINKNFNDYNSLLLKNQLSNLVVYKGHTAKFFGQSIKTFSGLSCYIPLKDDALLAYYQRFRWYRDSGFDILLN
jgi:hypothetical protein